MEMKLRSNAKKNFLVNGKILYRRADKFYSFRRRAIDAGEVFDLIIQEHQTNSTHSGKNKTFTALNQQFFSIKRQEVTFLLKHCRTCAQTKSQTRTTRAPLKPIKAHSVFERIQIDLIDMSTAPDGEYKWILRIVDHFSKFSSSFALKSKHAVEVAEKLALWIGLFGPPHILQCDNGTVFKDAVLLLLKKYGIKVLNDRPLTQGLVEKHNSTLKRKLQAWIQDSGGSRHWAQALPEIALSMNHQIHSTTGESPYRVVFKQQMRMQRLSFTDRVTAIPEDENLDGSESDASNRENDSESLADDGEYESEKSKGIKT